MNSLNKLLYCIVLGDNKLKNYIRYMNLEDMRAIRLGITDKFYVHNSNSAEILLKYIINKEKYRKIARKKFKKIKKRLLEAKNDR